MNNKDELGEDEKQTFLLQEILKWMKVGSIKQVKGVLGETLNSNQKKLVYHYSDGERKTTDFSMVAGVRRANTISNYWKEWKRFGILEGVPARGGERGKKIFALEDFGIPIPVVKAKERSELQEEDFTEAPVEKATPETEETSEEPVVEGAPIEEAETSQVLEPIQEEIKSEVLENG